MTLPDAALAADPSPKRPRGRPRKTAEDRDDGNRRRALIAAAAHLFRRKGFDATTTRDIAAATDMHSGSPFYHFKSKEALLYAVMEEGMHFALARLRQAVQAPEYAALPLRAQLRVLVEVHFDVLLGVDNDYIPVMLYEWRSLQLRERSTLSALLKAYEDMWLPVLMGMQESGQLKAPVRLARLLIFGALNWSVQWFDPTKEATLQELIDAAVNLFMKE